MEMVENVCRVGQKIEKLQQYKELKYDMVDIFQYEPISEQYGGNVDTYRERCAIRWKKVQHVETNNMVKKYCSL